MVAPKAQPCNKERQSPATANSQWQPKTRTQWRHGNPGQIFAIPGSQPQNTADC
jgi:hypothetical protein